MRISRPSLLARRSALGFWYSGESHHWRAASAEGNSMMTRRASGQSPSSTCALPPRTRNLPPYCSIVAGTVAVYALYPSGLVMFTSAMT